MQIAFITIIILVGLGIVFASILALAYKKFKVYEDPRIDQVEDLLPSANCGACGEPGCHAFAEKVVNREVNVGKCTVSSQEEILTIASYLGIEARIEKKRVARLMCAGGKNESHNLSEYRGSLSTCRGESVVDGGAKACFWGCLGLGDCESACDFDAIQMNENGLPVVIAEKCTACNDCVEVCPKGLFEILPLENRLLVQCKSLLEGDLAEERCSVACTGCSRCVADAAPELIHMKDNLAVINHELDHLATPAAIERCPTGAIVWLETDNQFEESDHPDDLNEVDLTQYYQ